MEYVYIEGTLDHITKVLNDKDKFLYVKPVSSPILGERVLDSKQLFVQLIECIRNE